MTTARPESVACQIQAVALAGPGASAVKRHRLAAACMCSGIVKSPLKSNPSIAWANYPRIMHASRQSRIVRGRRGKSGRGCIAGFPSPTPTGSFQQGPRLVPSTDFCVRTGPILAGIGGVTAGFLGALCCVAPLIVLTFGVGAGLASTFEPLRPLFGVVMVGAFGVGFYGAYRTDPACVSGECPRPRRGTERGVLWIALLVALLFWTFPAWSVWLL